MKVFSLYLFVMPSLAALMFSASILAADQEKTNILHYPPINLKMKQLLAEREQQQREAIKGAKAFHGFQFIDRTTESKITFEQRSVEDALKWWKPVHYDHGTGLAVADIDGDGRLDIYFVNQFGRNQLWRNLGGGKFEDITSRAGAGVDGKIHVTASFADIDNDGDPDLFVTTVKMGNVLLENLGNGRFRNVTRNSGLEYTGHSSSAVFFDFDRDGLLDVFVCNVGVYTTDQKANDGAFASVTNAFGGHLNPERTEPSRLYRNLGKGKFRDVSKETGLLDGSWTGDASFADLNGDGFPDLYLLNMQGDNHFYENIGGKRFVDKTAAYFPKTPWGAMGIKFFDFNLDGLADLFITDMHSDMSESQNTVGRGTMAADFERSKSEKWCTVQWTEAFLQGSSNNVFGNAFYLNKGGGKFEEVSDRIGAETYWPWGISVADLNADGYEDVFVTAGMGWPMRYAMNSVLLNENGQKFVDAEFVLGVEPRKEGRFDKPVFTLDCATDSHQLCKENGPKILVYGALSSRSSAIFDIDDDGDLDIVTNEMNDRPMVLVSDLSTKTRLHFLNVKLVGTKSNRDGIGATVKVTAGTRSFYRFNDGKSGYLSQSVIPLYFGLGEENAASSVEVTWPSGKKQVVTEKIPRNGMLRITEAGN